MEQYWNEISC